MPDGDGDFRDYVYLDHNATTPVAPEVLEEMLPYFSERFGNASSLHMLGRSAKSALKEARARVAALLNVTPEEITFTGGGTESINTALKSAFLGAGPQSGHAITSAVEHHATTHAFEYLAGFGVETTFLPVDRYATVDPEAVREAIRPDTRLISLLHANNEVGTIQRVEEIADLAAERGIPFHIDGVQAAGKIPVDLSRLPCTFYSMSGHKIYGPKGVGALFVRKNLRVQPLLHGGSQEAGRRAGTENLAGIVGLGKACELARERLPADSEKYWRLRAILLSLTDRLERVRLNGHPEHTVPNTVNLAFDKCDALALMLNLSLRAICVSTGSACSVGSLKPSHVLTAMGLNDETAYASLRFSMGRSNTEEQISAVVDQVVGLVRKLRLVSEPRTSAACGPDCPCFFR